MAYEFITTETDGPAFVLTLNRPDKRNAMSIATMAEMIAAAKEGEADEAVSAVILTGGNDFFSAGADLNDALAVQGAADGIDYFSNFHRLANAFETLKKPVIAAIEGFCMTGGCEIALACDIRIAGKGASFAVTSARIGTVAGAGGTVRLPRIVGPAKALEILFSAEPIDADEAYHIGLINRLVDTGGAIAEAKSLAALYATRAPMSLQLAKRAVYRGLQMDMDSALEFETMLVSLIYGTEDRKEGISAFLEKRTAEFKGK